MAAAINVESTHMALYRQSGLRLQSPPACVHTPGLLAWVLTQNFVLNEGGLPVVPSYRFVLLILPSLKHHFKFVSANQSDELTDGYS